MRSLKTLLVLSVVAAGCGGDDDGGPTPDGGGGGGEPPNISMVMWTFEAGCANGQSADVTFVTTVSDADTPAGDLTFSGSASGCTPTGPTQIGSANATFSCPNLAPYPGTVRVADPEGNEDSQSFTIDICTNGSAP